MKTHKELG